MTTHQLAKVSIIICTYNRVEYLHKTLDALAEIDIPSSMPAELIVVDNASTDATAEAVASCQLPNMPVQYIYEPRQGQCFARNRGVATAQGAVILFTDDDVRPPKRWIEEMCGPILSGEADVIGGGLAMPSHLKRPWMEKTHIAFLSCTDAYDPASFTGIIGGNMAFSKSVLCQVPFFDTELGPGALGFYDESLFTWQLEKAGFRSQVLLQVAVEHHFDPSRLSRASFTKSAVSTGKSLAYLAHHWEHKVIPDALLHLAKLRIRAFYHQIKRKINSTPDDVIPGWEISLVQQLSYYSHYLHERKRKRNYEKFGLIKIR